MTQRIIRRGTAWHAPTVLAPHGHPPAWSGQHIADISEDIAAILAFADRHGARSARRHQDQPGRRKEGLRTNPFDRAFLDGIAHNRGRQTYQRAHTGFHRPQAAMPGTALA